MTMPRPRPAPHRRLPRARRPHPCLRPLTRGLPSARGRTTEGPGRSGTQEPGGTAGSRQTAHRRRPHSPERGASSIEFAGMLPLLLLVAVAAVQLGIAGYAVQQAGTGARAAARTAAQEESAGACAGTGKAAMSGWTARRATVDCAYGDGAVTATTTVTIPSLVPGIDSFGSATRSVTMPSDEGDPA